MSFRTSNSLRFSGPGNVGRAERWLSLLAGLELLLAGAAENPREHPDQAMQALVNETRKMAQVCGASVRDAGLVASLQRLIHYKIAGYGAIAAYAKSLGMPEEAARFADHAERDKIVDASFSELARGTLNPQASVESMERAAAAARSYS